MSWRSEGIKYRKNEVFLDVIEAVNLLVSRLLSSFPNLPSSRVEVREETDNQQSPGCVGGNLTRLQQAQGSLCQPSSHLEAVGPTLWWFSGQ